MYATFEGKKITRGVVFMITQSE